MDVCINGDLRTDSAWQCIINVNSAKGGALIQDSVKEKRVVHVQGHEKSAQGQRMDHDTPSTVHTSANASWYHSVLSQEVYICM